MAEEVATIESETKTVDHSKSIEEDAKKVFSIEILRLIKDAQKQHGLRHGDYQRYRGNYFH